MNSVYDMDVQDLIDNRITCMYCDFQSKNSGGYICLANGNCPFLSMELEELRRICGITDNENH